MMRCNASWRIPSAIFDFIWQKYQHVEKLKMTIKEVKDEHKDTDGSPEVKQKIRKLQNEISQRASQQSSALELSLIHI